MQVLRPLLILLLFEPPIEICSIPLPTDTVFKSLELDINY